MRNMSYKNYSYRIHDDTARKIKRIKREKNLSYNLLFIEMLKLTRRRNSENEDESQTVKVN